MADIIVTGCDAAYFAHAQDLVESILDQPALGHLRLGFLDFGLDGDQRAWLTARRVLVREGGWDIEFERRDAWESGRPWFKAYCCRPHLRRHFPGYGVYAWIDADAWVQQAEAVLDLFEAAGRGGIAAVPEIDRHYLKFTSGFGIWVVEHETAVTCLGSEVGDRLLHAPVVNGGVFAMRHDAPQWDRYRAYLLKGLARVDPDEETSRMVEQVALNAAIHLHPGPVHRLPSTYNWLACLALPAWDVSRQLFVEPTAPFAPIGIVHLSLHVLGRPVTIPALVDRRPALAVTTPLTWKGRLGLVDGRDHLLAAAMPAAALAPSARV
jgi:hypothetical protein